MSPTKNKSVNSQSTIFLSPSESNSSNTQKNLDKSIENVIISVRNEFGYLNQLWDTVHMDLPTRECRVEQACEFMTNLLQDIRKSEEKMVRDIVSDLEIRRKAVTNLRDFLGLPSFDESLLPPKSIALLKVLDSEKTRLEAKREEIVGSQARLTGKYKALCDRVGTTARQIEGVHDRIMSEDELDKLKGEVNALQTFVNKRLEKALQLQAESKRIFETIRPSINSFNEDDLHFLRVDLCSQSIVLSSDFLKKMEKFNERLKDHHDLWAEQVVFRYDELLVKLNELSAKCFQPSTELPAKPNLENLSEKELHKLEEEVRIRQQMYERAKPVFDKLNEWMASWKQKLDTERRVCRASFYKNRAGSLNTKLKQRKIVEQKVPKLLNELYELCNDYVKNFQLNDIIVEGLRADKYAESVMQSYHQDREVQKAQKQFSTPLKPSTPNRPATSSASRRNVFVTTNSCGRTAPRALNPIGGKQQTPTPSRKDGETKRATRKRSFSCSQLSAIYPLAQMMEPRTSSPKPEENF
ncbi:hypothetical protein niasHT_005323 [Heterodera trifolii]|uniref:Protein regulator of cytokinesis 1 n=1 Tax=Heterodera trifolii TaxID=157864 RepID=A0ABD2M168_9BILA